MKTMKQIAYILHSQLHSFGDKVIFSFVMFFLDLVKFLLYFFKIKLNTRYA